MKVSKELDGCRYTSKEQLHAGRACSQIHVLLCSWLSSLRPLFLLTSD